MGEEGNCPCRGLTLWVTLQRNIERFPEELDTEEVGVELVVTEEAIENRILLVRGKKVLIDSDLAELYGVPTKVLNQAVKRNLERFPEDFMFQLKEPEVNGMRSQSVTTSTNPEGIRSQIVTGSKRNVRYLPYAFTEHGVIMAASVLNKP